MVEQFKESRFVCQSESSGSFDPIVMTEFALDGADSGLERPPNVNADGEFIYATSGYVGFPAIYQRPFECRYKEGKEFDDS
jgi:hypothetical protein